MGSQDGARNPWSAPSIQRGAPTGWGLGTMTSLAVDVLKISTTPIALYQTQTTVGIRRWC